MAKCPLFGLCGGCKFDFSADDYRAKKSETLPKIPGMVAPVWGRDGARRRADFAAAPNKFGFYKSGTRDIVNVACCPNLVPEINEILANMAGLPWECDVAVLITKCENGIVVNATSNVPYFSPEFKDAVAKLPPQIIRFTWNGQVVRAYNVPQIAFDDKLVDFPDGAFLQPTVDTEKSMRDLVVQNVAGAKRVVDLFCGIGNFTFATNATGFDINGCGVNRDLFKKPLTVKQLNQYDAIIMDPPRAGAMAQSEQIAKSNVPTVVYVSCNPATWARDRNILVAGGYNVCSVVPIDQFVASEHWELFSVFKK